MLPSVAFRFWRVTIDPPKDITDCQKCNGEPGFFRAPQGFNNNFSFNPYPPLSRSDKGLGFAQHAPIVPRSPLLSRILRAISGYGEGIPLPLRLESLPCFVSLRNLARVSMRVCFSGFIGSFALEWGFHPSAGCSFCRPSPPDRPSHELPGEYLRGDEPGSLSPPGFVRALSLASTL